MELQDVAEQIDDITNALVEQEEDLRLDVSGSLDYVSVTLERLIWDTESDPREWDDGGNDYKTTVEEYALSVLESTAAAILRATTKIRGAGRTPSKMIKVHLGEEVLDIPVYED